MLQHPDGWTADDATLTAWLNEEAVQAIRPTIDPGELYELVDSNEFNNLPQEQQNEVWNISLLFANKGVPTAQGTRARSRIIGIFGAQSTTINNLVGAISYLVTRAAAAGVGADTVTQGAVEEARRLYA